MMKRIEQSKLDMKETVDVLLNGGVIVYPTETCYGLGCDATNNAAVQRIFDIKERQKEKSVLIVFPDQHMAMEYVSWNPTLTELAEKYWPGPLTAVARLRHRVSLPAGVIASNGTIAFRISSHPLVEALSRGVGKPIVSTSANIASMQSPYDIDAVIAMFEEKAEQPDLLIDAGSLPHHAPSTIVSIDDAGGLSVLRQGEIVIDE